MEEFLLASVTWWSPGTTCHSPKKRISTTDTRSAVNVGWVMMLSRLSETLHEPSCFIRCSNLSTETLPRLKPIITLIETELRNKQWVVSINWMCSFLQINTCYTVPCVSTGENECLWTDWLLDNSLNGEQARQYSCIRRSDTTCSWYRGGPPPEKDFLDMTDPWFVIWVSIFTCEIHTRLAFVAQLCILVSPETEDSVGQRRVSNSKITNVKLLLQQRELKCNI